MEKPIKYTFRRSQAELQSIIDQFKKSGLSHTAFVHQEGVGVHQISY